MTRTPYRRLTTLAATLTIGLGLVLSGCAEDAEPTDAASPAATSEPSPSEPATSETATSETATETPSAEPAVQTIDITITADTVDPSGERVEATVGQEIILRVTAEAPGEIHVHSTPEQELTYGPGTTELPLTIEKPGLVDVESHNLDLVIVQLEVR